MFAKLFKTILIILLAFVPQFIIDATKEIKKTWEPTEEGKKAAKKKASRKRSSTPAKKKTVAKKKSAPAKKRNRTPKDKTVTAPSADAPVVTPSTK